MTPELACEITLQPVRRHGADAAILFSAGVDAVQLFDSWAGALSERDYRQFVFPHSARVLAGPADTGYRGSTLGWTGGSP